MSESVNNAALYLRLSKEDKEMQRESESIANQRLLLYQHAQKIGADICAEYVDDGVSGTKWEREGLQEMLDAVRSGYINTVLVKDLSRLSRDYIRTGELLEKWFPAHRVRFISVDDGIDTAAPSAVGDYAAIRAVMDDWYARDISKKVRAAVKSRRDAGFCTAASLPFGYMKANNEIVIRSDDAETVRMIFDLCRKGDSCIQIAEKLNAAGISSPRTRKSGWSDTTVHYILKNSAYIGKLRLHLTEKVSYKGNLRYQIPHGSQVIFPVPPIITNAEFEEVQHILQMNSHHRTAKHWLAGKAVCGMCGSILTVRSGKDLRLICGGRRRKNGCSNPSLRLDLFLAQLSEALSDNALPSDDLLLRRMVRKLYVTPEQVTVFLNCQKPKTAGFVRK